MCYKVVKKVVLPEILLGFSFWKARHVVQQLTSVTATECISHSPPKQGTCPYQCFSLIQPSLPYSPCEALNPTSQHNAFDNNVDHWYFARGLFNSDSFTCCVLSPTVSSLTDSLDHNVCVEHDAKIFLYILIETVFIQGRHICMSIAL